MTIKNMSRVLVLTLFLFLIAGNAMAGLGPERYIVYTTNSMARKAVGNIRYDFGDSFSAELSGFEMRVLRMLKIEYKRVPSFQISVSSSEIDGSYGGLKSEKVTGGLGVTVAILDTGIAWHGDLRIPVVCEDYVLIKTSQTSCEDKNGHGTFVAGLISAYGGSTGAGRYGLSPQSILHIYKVCNDFGICMADDVAFAIRRAVNNKANIINMSFASAHSPVIVEDAINYAVLNGVLIVGSAGNSGPFDNSVEYPASNPNVISVGAVDKRGKVLDWSSRGADLDFFAPGENIESTWLGNSYQTMSGTSISSAYVAGMAARIWSNILSDSNSALVLKSAYAPLVKESLKSVIKKAETRNDK